MYIFAWFLAKSREKWSFQFERIILNMVHCILLYFIVAEYKSIPRKKKEYEVLVLIFITLSTAKFLRHKIKK